VNRDQSFNVLRHLLDEAYDGLLALDENGTIVSANEAAAVMLGRDRRHLVGKPFAAVVPLDQRRAFRRSFDLAVSGGAAALKLSVSAGGDPVSVSLRRVPRHSPPRVSLALLAQGRTPAKHKTETPSTATAFYTRLPYAVVGVDRNSRVAFTNAHARALLGGTAVRTGHPLGEPNIPVPLAELADKALHHPASHVDAPLELPDGRILRITRVPPHHAEPAVLMFEDVTEQHRHDRVMREFVRNAAHQLRTPLTGITTAVEVLQAGAKDIPEDRDRFLEHIGRHAERLTRIARGLLVLARAQSGEQILRLEFVELLPLLEALEREADPAPGVQLETSCPPLLAALAEPNLVREALAALVDHAVAHTQPGTIHLAAREVNDHVEIDVLDNGPGILPEHRTRIFEPFFRTLETGEGFGLGLAIAAQAVQAMDGTLTAGDGPDGGTTFSVRLPSAKVMA
jgi:PAS domain S-box-containing protein